MKLKDLREEVWLANMELVNAGLVKLTWGNASGIDRAKGLVVIKPSGVEYSKLKPANLVVLDLAGRVVEGRMKPSTDTPTHLALYRAFEAIGGVSHTHSVNAVSFAQACMRIPCYGTTHADNFGGHIPVTRLPKPEETEADYELNTGRIIVECIGDSNPMYMPGVLVANHGPFTWGKDPMDSVRNSIALEVIAEMAGNTIALDPGAKPLPAYMLKKHFLRKHGENAYYGQGGQ
jgi:L-ribulose-5-phosphate 4-epimerase